MTEHFIQIQCPSCGSTSIEAVHGQNYRCEHCDSHFIFKDPRPQAPPPPPPPPPPSSYVQPQHYGPQVQVHVARPSAAGRIIGWLIFIVMFIGFGATSAIVAFVKSATGTTTTTRSSSTTTTTTTTTTTKTAAGTRTTTTTSTRPAPRTVFTPGHGEPAQEDPEPVTPAEAEPPPQSAATVDLRDYQALTGCGCRTDADGDGRRDQVDLYLKAASGTSITSAGTQTFVETAFAVAGEGVAPFALPVTADSAPANRYPAGRFALGVGCDGQTMVIAALGAVSAWSLKDHTLRWAKPLEPAFSRFAEGKAAVDCRSLSVSSGVVRVHTDGGATQTLRLDSGEPEDRRTATKSRSEPVTAPPKPDPPKTDPKPDPPKTDPKPEPTPVEPDPPKSRPKPKPKPAPEPAPVDPKKKKKKKGGGKKGGKDPG